MLRGTSVYKKKITDSEDVNMQNGCFYKLKTTIFLKLLVIKSVFTDFMIAILFSLRLIPPS
jgi:hypothetical protein